VSRVLGAALVGVDGVPVEVEVRISSQLPRTDIVGLPEAAVRESAARVRAAITAIGHSFPDRRVTVNLAPASLRKSGAGLDLPIAVGVLAASAAVPGERLEKLLLAGELALDGRLRPVRGALALVLAAREAGCARVVLPAANAAEGAVAPGIEVLAANGLADVAAYLVSGRGLSRARPVAVAPRAAPLPDLRDVRGQERAKRALEVVAAGGHALFLRGAPGSGKTMLARRLPGLLPPLDFEEALDVTRIHGAAGLLGGEPIARRRPFRAPHHTASPAGLLGGGNPPRPGEVSLAHRGVLFLDELPEFDRRCLEALRQVLESGEIALARARHTCVFPARVQLVAAANPCPCGWLGSGTRDCRCDELTVARYSRRISGPLLDRIDLHVGVRPVPWRELDHRHAGDDTARVRARVAAARARQAERAGECGASTNALVPDAALDTVARATPDARALLGRAVDGLGLSARAARRLLRVARTIADLRGDAETGPEAMAEALGYRPEPGVGF